MYKYECSVQVSPSLLSQTRIREIVFLLYFDKRSIFHYYLFSAFNKGQKATL